MELHLPSFLSFLWGKTAGLTAPDKQHGFLGTVLLPL